MKAFPNMTGEQGMDLRDYFAAKAMQAMMPMYLREIDSLSKNTVKMKAVLCRQAYWIAEQMIETRDEQLPKEVNKND